VQAIHGIPVKALPCSRSVMQPEVEERQYCVVDLVGVEFHAATSVGLDHSRNHGAPRRVYRPPMRWTVR
jgi:hypothetical protein